MTAPQSQPLASLLVFVVQRLFLNLLPPYLLRRSLMPGPHSLPAANTTGALEKTPPVAAKSDEEAID